METVKKKKKTPVKVIDTTLDEQKVEISQVEETSIIEDVVSTTAVDETPVIEEVVPEPIVEETLPEVSTPSVVTVEENVLSAKELFFEQISGAMHFELYFRDKKVYDTLTDTFVAQPLDDTLLVGNVYYPYSGLSVKIK